MILGILPFYAACAVLPFAIWRVAKRTGHGRLWDALFLLHLVAIPFLLLAIDTYDPIGAYCDPSWGAGATQWTCAKARFAEVMGWMYMVLVFLLPAALALKRWPRNSDI